jgi:hypothetical protein
MSWSKVAIFLGIIAFVGGTSQEKSGKFLFNIVRFANDACVAADGKTGVCMTSSECTSAGGGASGTCAKGYGTCCLLVKNTCDDLITANNTYIRNPDYSASWDPTSSTNCKFTLENPGDICQYRLDFDDFNIQNPDVTAVKLGDCSTDSMTITDVNKRVLPVICGKNSGQHMYVSAGVKSDKAVIDFKILNAATWDIKVTQIKCGDPMLAPTGALQYYTGGMGLIETFNFAGSKQLLQGQDYTLCVRPEAGSCGIEWTEDADTTYAFLMSTGVSFTGHTTGVTQAALDSMAGVQYQTGPLVGMACSENWITIPGAYTIDSAKEVSDSAAGVALPAKADLTDNFKYLGPQDRMCGYHLNNRGMTGALYESVVANAAGDGGIQAEAAAAVATPDFGASNIMDTVISKTSYCMTVHSGLNAALTAHTVVPTGFKLMYKTTNKC